MVEMVENALALVVASFSNDLLNHVLASTLPEHIGWGSSHESPTAVPGSSNSSG